MQTASFSGDAGGMEPGILCSGVLGEGPSFWSCLVSGCRERSLVSVLSWLPHLPRGRGSATEGAGGPLVQWQKGMEFQEVLWEAIK